MVPAHRRRKTSRIRLGYAADMFAVMRMTLQLEHHAHSMQSFAAAGAKPHPIPVTMHRQGTARLAAVLAGESPVGAILSLAP